MPRLGGAEEEDNNTNNNASIPLSNRPAVGAYPNRSSFLSMGFGNTRNGSCGGFWKVIFLLSMAVILRNMFLKDYRLEEINFLRQNGKSQEEISQIIPDTQKERKDKAISFLSLQANINTLNQKVADLELKMMRVNLDDGGARNEEEEGKGDDEVGGKDNLQDKDEEERNESPKKAKSRSNETYKSNPIRVTDKKSLRRSKDGHAHAADEKVKD